MHAGSASIPSPSPILSRHLDVRTSHSALAATHAQALASACRRSVDPEPLRPHTSCGHTDTPTRSEGASGHHDHHHSPWARCRERPLGSAVVSPPRLRVRPSPLPLPSLPIAAWRPRTVHVPNTPPSPQHAARLPPPHPATIQAAHDKRSGEERAAAAPQSHGALPKAIAPPPPSHPPGCACVPCASLQSPVAAQLAVGWWQVMAPPTLTTSCEHLSTSSPLPRS